MAKQRFRADLSETMETAKNIINSASDVEQEPASENQKEKDVEGKMMPENIAEAPTEVKKSTSPGRKKSTDTGSYTRGPKSGTVGKGHLINANLDEETYWRANAVKIRLNKERTSKEEAFVSINTLLCTALRFWLDKKYPETREQYKLLQEMGMV